MKKWELNNQFDSLDIDILNELMRNARIPYMQLAKDLNVSNSLIHQRINKLKQSGVLKKPQFEINPFILGYSTIASTGIILKESRYVESVVNELRKIPEVVECINITGNYALLVKIYAIDNNHLRSILYEKIHIINGVEGTNTSIAFDEGFSRNIPLKR